jgi:cytochrome c-type biogenesis protein CcmH
MTFWRILAVFLALSGPALAVRPDEMLADPALEARARKISQELRCLVCQNENIDDSDAQLAGDLRVLLRERLLAGDSDEQAVDFIVARYGEFVLLKPPARGINLALWLAGPGLLVIGGGLAFAMLRRRSQSAGPEPLSAEEEARLAEILKK